jgi:dihydrofolate reductase
MGKLIYSMNVSLDGYVETPDHSLDWAQIDEEIHSWFNEQARETVALLYGRRMYEVMSAYWPYAEFDRSAVPYMLDFARIWSRTPKVVFSSTLAAVRWNSRLVRGDPIRELVRLRTEFAGNLSVGGPTIAATFIQAGLVDEFRVVVHPVILGSGTPFLPALDSPLRLRLFDTYRFKSGAVYVGYEAVRTADATDPVETLLEKAIS